MTSSRDAARPAPSELSIAEIAARLERVPLRGTLGVVVAAALANFFDIGDTANLSIVAPTLRKVMGLTTAGLAVAVALTFVGAFVGALSGGYLSDRFGRLRVLKWSTGITSLFTLAGAAAQDQVQIIVARLVAGLGIGALFVVAMTYLVELSPVSLRSRRASVAAIVGVSGPAVIATFARFVIPTGPDGWRLVLVVGGLGLLLLIPLRWMPESPLWLISKGRSAAAEGALQRIERRAGPDLAEPVLVELPEPEKSEGRGAWRQLFRGALLVPTILLTAMWIIYSVLSQSFTIWLPTILDLRQFGPSLLLTITAVSLYGAPAGALLAYFGNRFLSRSTLMISLCLVAVGAAALFFLSSATAAVMAGGFALIVASGALSPLVGVTTAEEYPASLRATGSGFSFSMSRLMNIVAPIGLAAMLSAGGLAVGWFLAGGWALLLATFAALRIRHSRRDKVRSTGPATVPAALDLLD